MNKNKRLRIKNEEYWIGTAIQKLIEDIDKTPPYLQKLKIDLFNAFLSYGENREKYFREQT